MTTDSKAISELTDSELSEAIAVEVMGWHQLERRMVSHDMPPVWVGPGDSRTFNFWPASNIAHAFDALEAGRRKGFVVTIYANPTRRWSFCMSDEAVKTGLVVDSGGYIRADDLPRQLCRCLLTAVREQKKGTVEK